jgi:hypothetical protein
MINAQQRSRKLLAIGAWIVLVAVALSYITLIPSVDAAIDRASGHGFGKLILASAIAVTGAAFLATWFGAVWHARVTPHSSRLIRSALLALLVVGNGAAGFFYYFGYVLWAEPSSDAPAG